MQVILGFLDARSLCSVRGQWSVEMNQVRVHNHGFIPLKQLCIMKTVKQERFLGAEYTYWTFHPEHVGLRFTSNTRFLQGGVFGSTQVACCSVYWNELVSGLACWRQLLAGQAGRSAGARGTPCPCFA